MAQVRSLSAAQGAAVFLTYHRVGNFEYDPMHLSISPELFKEQLEEFSKRYVFMTAGEVFSTLSRGENLPQSVLVLTFDDGYKDMIEEIEPLIKETGAKASFFITAERRRPYWWDELMICTPRVQDLKNFHIYLEPENEAQVFYVEQADLLANMDLRSRGSHLAQLTQQKGEHLNSLSPEEHIAEEVIMHEIKAMTMRLSDEDIYHLGQCEHIEIGSHTFAHPRLSTLPRAEQRREIAGSKRELEMLSQQKVNSFSYPYGTFDSVSSDSIEMVEEAGYLGAVSTELLSFNSKIPFGALYSKSSTMARYFSPRIATNDKSTEGLISEIDKFLAR